MITDWEEMTVKDACILRYSLLFKYSLQDIFWGFWCNTKCFDRNDHNWISYLGLSLSLNHRMLRVVLESIMWVLRIRTLHSWRFCYCRYLSFYVISYDRWVPYINKMLDTSSCVSSLNVVLVDQHFVVPIKDLFCNDN